MRSNVVSEASLSTRVSQWWSAVPFLTSGIVFICGVIYAVCLLFGYDSFYEVCLLPSAIAAKYEVYRIYTSTLFHVSILHLVFNMLALVPIGSGLERILGSVRYFHVLFLIATCNGILHLLFALLAAHNPVHPYSHFMNECSIGFSGMIFAMIVMETSLSGVQHRSIFGFFNVPAKWYAWILLILFQLLMPNVSLLGHLCGILSGFAYTYGVFNPLLFGSSTYSALESSWLLASCVRRPGFIVGAGVPVAPLPTVSSASGNGNIENIWRGLRAWTPSRSWMSSRETPIDERFPGRGRTLGSGASSINRASSGNDSDLQARLLDGTSAVVHVTEASTTPNFRPLQGNSPSAVHSISQSQDSRNRPDSISSLVSMGFEQKKAEVALDAANGDLAMAVEILSSQEH
ncbi:hypothetical protein KP509_29G070900 [Ceratopteris richardii]|uniref:UBA domain-containing protein n=2 Tax=Ceratopteris richardii TaxID=49495 RepID=A0A8T2R9Q4_CERRI|nr:hypothetical protein KP509_29G070900 [Ceratopteris richardii]KAH7292486.1 hypothetical protein KP509_29G070900 [Ceratopteris richardii]